MSRNVLVSEGDNDIAQLVRMQLAGLACETTVLNDGRAGLAEALPRPYDLVVLDLMLPTVHGLEICRCPRSERRYTPILMPTAKSTKLDRAPGLEMDADNYLAKPFSVLEFVARVKAIFRIVDMLADMADGEHTLIECKDLNRRRKTGRERAWYSC